MRLGCEVQACSKRVLSVILPHQEYLRQDIGQLGFLNED